MMKYCSLSPQYQLRGWIGLPYGLVHDGDVTRLTRDEFNALAFCDGKTDTGKIHIKEIQDTLHSLEAKGIICCSETPKEISREQYYRHYDNHYIHDIYWSVTGRCNFRCRHCYINAPDAGMGEMSYEEAISVIDQMAECGIYHMLVSGGEPFVRKDFWELVDHALEKGIRIDQVYTNGWMVNNFLLDKFEERGMKPEFSISFDGVDWHDWMRGVRGAEQAALNALKYCYLRGFPTNVEMCMHRGNADPAVLRETIEVLADCCVGSIKISDVSVTDLWKKNAEGNDMSLREYTDAVLRYLPYYFADGMPMNILFSGVVELYKGSKEYWPIAEFGDGTQACLNRFICGAVRRSCYLAPDGRLLPCMPIAAVPEQDMFPKVQEIGLQAAMKESLVIEFAKRKVKDLVAACQTCRECPYHLKCGGGCRASAVMDGEKNLMGPDPFRCMMWKEGYLEKVLAVCDESIRKYCGGETLPEAM